MASEMSRPSQLRKYIAVSVAGETAERYGGAVANRKLNAVAVCGRAAGTK